VTYLLYSDPEGHRQCVELTEAWPRLTIGRRPACDIALPWDDEVSRLHAELMLIGDDWVVHDHGLSRNGTYINGRRVGARRRLHAGDALCVGATTILVCARETSGVATRAAHVHAERVAVTPAQQRLLDVLCRPIVDDGYAAPASNRRIADELVLSLDTVKGTLSALYERFGVSALAQNEKRAALARRALAQR
jgi:pSer/pThr/pTyr-binding forkhead associated (FHA) protein